MKWRPITAAERPGANYVCFLVAKSGEYAVVARWKSGELVCSWNDAPLRVQPTLWMPILPVRPENIEGALT